MLSADGISNPTCLVLLPVCLIPVFRMELLPFPRLSFFSVILTLDFDSNLTDCLSRVYTLALFLGCLACPSGSGPGLVIQTVSYISHFRQLLLPSPTGPQRLIHKPSHPPNCCKRLSFRDYPRFAASLKQSSLPSRSRPQGIGQTELINTCRTLAV